MGGSVGKILRIFRRCRMNWRCWLARLGWRALKCVPRCIRVTDGKISMDLADKAEPNNAEGMLQVKILVVVQQKKYGSHVKPYPDTKLEQIWANLVFWEKIHHFDCKIFQILHENKISSNLAQRCSIIISTGDPSFKPEFQRIGSHPALWCPRGVCQKWPKFWHHRLSPSFLEISNSD